MRFRAPTITDLSAVLLSGLCLFHCLALPLLAAILPVAGVLGEAEWVHKVLVLTALPVSAFVILWGPDFPKRKEFMGLAVFGLALLLGAAFIEPLHDFETPITVAGALLLGAAHVIRWLTHRNCEPQKAGVCS